MIVTRRKILQLLLITVFITALINIFHSQVPNNSISASSFNEKNDLYNISQLQDYEKRKKLVKKTCTSASTSGHMNNPIYINWMPIYIFNDQKVAYCMLRKVGSSTFSSDMVQLEEIESKDYLYKIIDRNFEHHSPKKFKSMNMDDFHTFIFVRHPFARLASAYRDKADRDPSHPSAKVFYSNLFNSVMKRYRPGQKIPHGSKLTFKEFVRYLIDDPVKYFNMHWMPYWLVCDPCLIDYDFIGKMETFTEDRKFLYTLVGVYNNVSKISWSNNSESQKFYQRYFSQLTRDELQKLYLKFKVDFDMFGYTPNEFYAYTSS